MTPAQIIFCVEIACVVAGLALACWLGRCSRDKEVRELSDKASFLRTNSDSWAARAKERLEELQKWRVLAIEHSNSAAGWEKVARDNEALAKKYFSEIPKRGPGGQFAKKK